MKRNLSKMQQEFCVPKMLQLFTVVKEMFICKNTSLLKCVQLFTNQQREDILQHDIIIIFKTYRCKKAYLLKFLSWLTWYMSRLVFSSTYFISPLHVWQQSTSPPNTETHMTSSHQLKWVSPCQTSSFYSNFSILHKNDFVTHTLILRCLC